MTIDSALAASREVTAEIQLHMEMSQTALWAEINCAIRVLESIDCRSNQLVVTHELAERLKGVLERQRKSEAALEQKLSSRLG